MNVLESKKLTIRPYAFPHEGARGYVQRLATVNGLRSVGSMNPQRVFLTVDELSGLLGRDDRTFWEKHPEKVYWDSRSAKDRRIWNWKNRKCCPECLLESSYWRVEWELDGMPVCPKHKVKLVNTCTNCSQPLSWHTQLLAECQCGFNLTQIDSESCSDAERVLGLAVTAKLGQNECPEHLRYLEHLKLEALFDLTNYLGRIGTTHGTNSPGTFTAAASILNEWPAKYRSTLVGIQQTNKSEKGVPSISQTFGKVYTNLYAQCNLENLEFVRNEFESHINENWEWPIDHKNRRLPQEIRNNRNWIPARQAGMELNIRYRLLKLVTEANIESQTVVLPSGRKYLSIREKDLKTLHEILTNKITLFKATTMLGISEKRVKSLIESGVLQTDTEKQSSAEKWEITRASLLELLAKGQEVQEVTEVGKEHLLLRNLAKGGLRNSSMLPALIKEIVSGRIEVTARLRNANGIGGWLIEVSKYDCWKKTQIQFEEEYYSIQEAAQVLKVKKSAAYQFAKYGLLKTDTINCNGFCRAIVTRSSLDEFRSKYVFGRDLANELGTSPRKTIQLLDEMDVHPTRALQRAVKLQAVFEKTSELVQCWNTVLERNKSMGKQLAAKRVE